MSGHPLCQQCRECLCDYAAEIEDEEELTPLTFPHHSDVLDLQESANTKCPVCVLLLRQIQPLLQSERAHDPDASPSTRLTVQPSYRFPTDHAFNIVAYANGKHTRFRESLVDFELIRSEDVLDYHYFGTLNLSTSTNSPETWSIVSQWLDRCITNHPKCSSAFTKSNWYPSRLIDVGKGPDDTIKLILTSETFVAGGYLTLSHRWGDAVTVKLLRSNIKDLMHGIPFSSLPLTFQQATETTRRLKHRYLWIDSLCIMQDEDDKSDWLQQAGQMEKIYNYGFLNLAATRSVDSSQGLYRNRDPICELAPSTVSFAYPVPGEKSPDLEEEFALLDVDVIKRELNDAPLNLRAWVFQERLLSHRVLHFGSGQLFWECKQGVLCERFPGELPFFLEAGDYALFEQFELASPTTATTNYQHDHPPKKIPLNQQELWAQIIESYSQTHLTFLSDRVIALAGVAKALRNTLQNRYVAGMWRSDMEAQLLWRVERTPQRSSFRPTEYRAPTWSWMSVEGKVQQIMPSDREMTVQILDVSLTHHGDDDTGPIADGSLTVKGLLRSLDLEPRAGSGTTPPQTPVDKPFAWTWKIGGKQILPSSLTNRAKRGFRTYLDVPGLPALSPSSSSNQNANNSASRNDLFMLSMTRPLFDEETPDANMYYHVLLLQCIDWQSGVFQRFGTAILDVDEEPEIWEMLQMRDDDEAVLPCVRYDEEAREHTIVIK